jgi:hypothetical protein
VTLTFGAPRKGWPTFGPDGKVLREPVNRVEFFTGVGERSHRDALTDAELVKQLDDDQEAELDA